MNSPADDELLAATNRILRAHDIIATRGQVLLLHNALAGANYDAFRKIFGFDVSTDFADFRPTKQHAVYADDQEDTQLDKFDYKRALKPTQIFVASTTIRQAIPDLLLAGTVVMMRQMDDGVLVEFASELSVKVFQVAYPTRYQAYSATRNDLKEPQQKPDLKAKTEQVKKGKGESFPSNLFVHLHFDAEMTLDDIRATFEELDNFEKLHAIYKRDAQDYVLLFKENNDRIKFSKQWSGSTDVTAKWMKTVDFLKEQQQYNKVWPEQADR